MSFYLAVLLSLCSGLLGSALTIYLTRRWESITTQRKLRNYSLLLLMEVNRHRYWILHLDSFTKKLLLQDESTEWQHTKYFFAEHLTYENFSVLERHFQSKQAFCKVIQEVPTIYNDALAKYVRKANEAYLLLYKLAEVTEANYPHDEEQ